MKEKCMTSPNNVCVLGRERDAYGTVLAQEHFHHFL